MISLPPSRVSNIKYESLKAMAEVQEGFDDNSSFCAGIPIRSEYKEERDLWRIRKDW
jgi:hypothetical protein